MRKITFFIVMLMAMLFSVQADAFQWNWTAEQTPQFKSKSGLVNTDNVRQPLWKFTGRELSNFRCFDGQSPVQAGRRAATKDEHGIITDPDEGVTKYYKRAGTGYYASNGFVYNEDQSGIVTIVECEDAGTVYIKDPVSHYAQGTWVKGTKDGNTITVAGAQPLAWNSSYSATLSLNWGNVQTTQNGNTYLRGEGDITFTVDDEAGTITLDGSSADKIIAVFWDDDNSWSGWGDYGTVWTVDPNYQPASTDLIVLPDGAEVQQWYAEGAGLTDVPTDVKVAFVGNEVYISGLTSNFPTAWIKGTLEGTTVTFSGLQFVGMYNSTMPIWAVGADSQTGALQDFTMTYDSEAKTLTLDEGQILVFNAADDKMYYLSYIQSLTIYAEEPAPAVIDELPYYNSFDDAASQKHFTIIDANEDGRTWSWYNGMVRYTYHQTNQGDDWLISPQIYLQAGKTYIFNILAHAQMASYPERIEVKVAKVPESDNNAPTAALMAAGTEVIAPSDVTTTGFVPFTNDAFTVAETGYYYIGVHAISNADSYYLYVDDFEVKLKEPEDIEISPESGANISEALATAEEGKNVKNITINLAEGGNYTISASIVAPANVTINGNGATIDASALTTPFIQMSATPCADANEQGAYPLDGITVKDVTITGLAQSLVDGKAAIYYLKAITIDNSIIQVSGSKHILDFQGKGLAEVFTIKNSTLWAKDDAKHTGRLYQQQSGKKPSEVGAEKLQVSILNSTLYNISNGQNYMGYYRQNSQTYQYYDVKNSVLVNCAKAGIFVKSLNQNSNGKNANWSIDGNLFNYNNADTSADEVTNMGQKDNADIVQNSVTGVVAFTDAANGDFNGEIAITWGKDIPAALPGDPRWTLTSSQAPAVPDGNYVVANLSFDPLKYLANGNVSKYGTTFTTAYDKATKTTTLKAGDQYLQEDLTLGATAFGWTVDEDATYGNNIYKMDGETKKFIGVDEETNNLVFVEDATNATIAWGFFYPEYFYAMMALREVTGPLAGTMKLNEGTGLWEYTAKKVLMTDATSINVQVVINGEADKTYPEEAKVVTLADMGEGATAGCYAITITYNDEGNVVTVSGTKLEAEDIIVEPADISAVDGDIAAAVEAKTDGKLIKSLTINLGENFEYTISNTILTDGSVIINGNGSKIDASDLKKPFIQMSATPSVVANDKGGYEIDGVTIKDVTITGLPYQLFYANKQNYLLKQLLVENSVIGINGTNKKTIFDFNGGGNVLDLTVNKSTLWANPTNAQNGGFFSSQSGKKITDLSSATDLRTTLTITSSTLYNIANGKTVNSLRDNNQAYQYVVIKDNVIVDCGKKNEFLVGLMAGRIDASKVANWTVSGNVINWGGADVLAAEATKSGLTDIGIAGAVTFTDAANGDFNGTFTAAPVEEPVEESASRRDAEQTTLLNCGDPRWTIVCVQGYAINIDAKFGNVTTAPASYAAEGEEVTITAKPSPADKFELLTLKAEGVTSDIEIELTPVAGTTDQFTFTMPADAVNITATFQRIAEDIIVNPEDITDGNIAAALDAKIASYDYLDPLTEEIIPVRVKNIYIILTPGESYTLTKTLTAPNNIMLVGATEEGDELAVINVAEGVTADVITLDGTEKLATKADGTLTDHKRINMVAITGVAVYDLQGAVVKDIQKTQLEVLAIHNAIIQMPDAQKNVIDFSGKGYVANAIVQNSTIYAEKKNTGFFAQYGSRPKNIDGNDTSLKQTFNVQNSTFANIANGKNFCDLKQNGTAQNENIIKNNIFTDCGKQNQVIVGFNKGQKSATPIWDVNGNIFNWQKNDNSAQEATSAGQKDDEDIVKNSLTCRVLFSDVEKPDFGGILVLAPGTEAPETLPGDPRWSLSALDGNTITVQTSNGHGTASAQYPYAIEGEEVGLTVKPEEGYVIESIVMLDADGYVIGLVTGDTFTMPGQDVIIYVGFKNTATGIDAIENDADFDEGEWYTINGVRVDQPTKKGLYIHNGRKVVIK
jgi:hypothetical protein